MMARKTKRIVEPKSRPWLERLLYPAIVAIVAAIALPIWKTFFDPPLQEVSLRAHIASGSIGKNPPSSPGGNESLLEISMADQNGQINWNGNWVIVVVDGKYRIDVSVTSAEIRLDGINRAGYKSLKIVQESDSVRNILREIGETPPAPNSVTNIDLTIDLVAGDKIGIVFGNALDNPVKVEGTMSIVRLQN